MDPAVKNLIKVGIVSSVNAAACTARVAFEDKSNVVSYELPVIVRGSLQTKDYWLPVPGEQVLCVFLPSGNARGFIIGSVYSEKDKPPTADTNKRLIEFADGTVIEFDHSTSTLTINTTGQVNIIAAGNVNVTGDVIADGVSLKTHTHSDVTPGAGSSGPPERGA